VFMAVNPESGGFVSKQLLDLRIPRFELAIGEEGSNETMKVVIFNQKSDSERDDGFEELGRLASEPEKYDVRLVACGGDGTVKWIISCLQQVNALHVPIAIIPFGTGNDLARALGWGSKPPNPLIGKAMLALQKRLRMILYAETIPLDVWRIRVHLADGESFFQEVKDKKVVRTHNGELYVNEVMINYFSIGADGELMFQFEQNRQKSQLRNKLVYVKKGGVQAIVPPRRLRKFLDFARAGLDAVPAEDGANPGGESFTLDESDRMLLFLNIPSYGSGADPWRRKKDSKPKAKFKPQFVGDNTVEVMTVRNTPNVGMSLTTGTTFGLHRIHQGQEYYVKFKPDQEVFFQIDGEAIKATNPSYASIEHAYQVRLLRAKNAKAHAFPEGYTPPIPEESQPEAVPGAHGRLDAEAVGATTSVSADGDTSADALNTPASETIIEHALATGNESGEQAPAGSQDDNNGVTSAPVHTARNGDTANGGAVTQTPSSDTIMEESDNEIKTRGSETIIEESVSST